MRRGVEVAVFRYDLRAARVVGKVAVAAPEQLPIGTFGLDGRLTRPLFEKWVSARAVPFARAERIATRFGFDTSDELMLSTLGLSLSDQYWFRPPEVDVDWESVNPYDNVFDTTLGQALTPEDDESASRAIAVIDGDPTVIYSSPDAACGGNLPKYWCIDDRGVRRLCKSGKAANGIPPVLDDPQRGRLRPLRVRARHRVSEGLLELPMHGRLVYRAYRRAFRHGLGAP